MSIQAEIGLNTTPFMKGVKEVQAATERMSKNIQKSAAPDSHGFELKGGAKAGKAWIGLSNDLAQADSAGMALAMTLERAGKILKLGLGAFVVAGLSAKLYESGRAMNEHIEKLRENLEKLKETAGNAALFGGFTENLAAMKEAESLSKELAKSGEKLGSFKGFLGQLFTGSIFTGESSKAFRDIGAGRRDLEKMKEENAEAGLDDLDLQTRIAQAKARGDDEHAAKLERERKLNRDILSVERSNLSPAQKEEAKNMLLDKAGAEDAAPEAARKRALHERFEKDRIAANERINQLQQERERLNETEEQHAARLVSWLNENYFLAGQTVEYEEKTNELAKLYGAQQVKNNAEMQRAGEDRKKEGLRGQIETNKHSISELEALYKGHGSPGEADQNRRVGLGGAASRGSDAWFDEARASRNILAEIRTLMDRNNQLTEQLKNVGKTGGATFQ